MTETTIALVTGANKGLGHTAARRLAEHGWQVLIGSRDGTRGKEAAAELAAAGHDVAAVELDVTDDASVAAAAERIDAEFGRLDVLVNNAGITGTHVGTLETGPDDLRECYETNVFGPVRVTRAMLGLLTRSAAPRIVMVSSGMGSLAIQSDPGRFEAQIPGMVYQSSKAALNMITVKYANDLPRMRVNVVDPGYTATDLNGHSGYQTVEEGTDAIVAMATVGPDGPTGTYSDRSGPMPW